MQNLILGGVIREIFKIQGCYVLQKSIFDLFGKKRPARMVTVNLRHKNEYYYYVILQMKMKCYLCYL